MQKRFWEGNRDNNIRNWNNNEKTGDKQSLLQNKVFIFEVHDGMHKNMYTINYELAYTVSLEFIFTILVARYKILEEKRRAIICARQYRRW